MNQDNKNFKSKFTLQKQASYNLDSIKKVDLKSTLCLLVDLSKGEKFGMVIIFKKQNPCFLNYKWNKKVRK